MNEDWFQTHLIKENVIVVYVHNAILQSAFPLALGPRNLHTQMYYGVMFMRVDIVNYRHK